MISASSTSDKADENRESTLLNQNHDHTHLTHPSPTPTANRLLWLDALRGFALFGVLIVNLRYLSGNCYLQWAKQVPQITLGDKVTTFFQNIFLEGKSITLFSLMFAIGLCMQADKAEANGDSFWVPGLRRLAALFGFGSLHILLLWSGDILTTYAICGVMILSLRRFSWRALLWMALAIELIGVYLIYIADPLHAIGALKPFTLSYWRTNPDWFANVDASIGSWNILAGIRYRAWEFVHLYLGFRAYNILTVTPVFLLGMGVWKSGLIQNASQHRGSIKSFTTMALILGVATNALNAMFGKSLPAWLQSGLPAYGYNLLLDAGVILLALGYAGVFLLTKPQIWLMKALSYLGKMAFTNYLSHSLFGLVLFAILGYWKSLGPMALILCGTAFFIIQIGVSKWWLRRFSYGPMEWLWRGCTYGLLPRFKRE